MNTHTKLAKIVPFTPPSADRGWELDAAVRHYDMLAIKPDGKKKITVTDC
jgi:hypothetical protein